MLLLVVAGVSLLITRVATIALTVTGMSRPSARFQARSALTGVGFTTSEAEAVVNHPVRRRIIMALMLLGSVGLATAVAGLLAGMLRSGGASDALLRAVILAGGLAAIYAASLSSAVDRRLSQVIGRLLRRFTDLDTRDYAALLHISGDYAVKEMLAQPDGWLAGQSLGELRLRDEGVLVLGVIRRDKAYIGVPTKETVIEAGDTVVAYGRQQSFEDLSRRHAGRAGDRAHAEAVAHQHEDDEVAAES